MNSINCGAYSSLDVAKCIIDRCTRIEKPTNNVKLQHILYYLWTQYHYKTGRYLFDEEFIAVPVGPRLPTVYDTFCVYAAAPIRKIYSTKNIALSDKFFIYHLVDFFVDFKTRELTKMIKDNDSAWSAIYSNGRGKNRIIPFDTMLSAPITIPKNFNEFLNKPSQNNFRFFVNNIFEMKKSEIIVTGSVDTGVIHVGDKGVVLTKTGSLSTAAVKKIITFGKSKEQAVCGEECGLLIKSNSCQQIECGSIFQQKII